MNVSASQVKELREKTGIGMMECKKALEITEGNLDEAIEYLRKHNKNLTKVNNRVATEGIVRCYVINDMFLNNASTGVILEVNTETDFSARTELVDKLVDDLCVIIGNNDVNIDSLVTDKISNAISVLGEKIVLRRFNKVDSLCRNMYAYNHQNRVAVLVIYEGDKYESGTEEIVKNVAMQIASMSPEYVGLSDIPDDIKEKEKEIITEQIRNDPSNANKPENIINNIIIAKLKKVLQEKCLLSQIYVKAEKKKTVYDYLHSTGNAVNIVDFIRYEVGEGLENKSSYEKQREFVDEISRMVGDVKTVANPVDGTVAVAVDEGYFSEDTKRKGMILNQNELVR